ncbi:glyoxylase-like metal-dependent hydrolase (beta-lactamase superfamily II) [Saccharothrix carnea]|uniref:Glyoxylase-like metal-dependent hydrolase (Beta-lactamase superfamily II) n=1 Tax=Saccharothrix carnea TaxID=1280637 RepID=A0A2P8HGC5_SACCR|nr:glyoxylase-like metal-dependent hydrolase (beta-lactamase superfamily II) [Saccharothrix carnea]
MSGRIRSAIVDVLEDYTGHVTPGGPAARRTLDALTITKISVGPMDNNAYLLVCRATNEGLLIDAAADPERLSDVVGHSVDRPRLKTVVTTHRHQDHWGALGAVAGANGSNTVAHAADAEVLPIPPDVLVEHGDTVHVGEVPLTVIHLRGHTPGSIALLYRGPTGHPHLFTGDSLFPGGVGKTTSPETFTSLIDDVESRIFAELPDDTWVYPGHGDDTTLGRERPHLAEWRSRGW